MIGRAAATLDPWIVLEHRNKFCVSRQAIKACERRGSPPFPREASLNTSSSARHIELTAIAWLCARCFSIAVSNPIRHRPRYRVRASIRVRSSGKAVGIIEFKTAVSPVIRPPFPRLDVRPQANPCRVRVCGGTASSSLARTSPQ